MRVVTSQMVITVSTLLCAHNCVILQYRLKCCGSLVALCWPMLVDPA